MRPTRSLSASFLWLATAGVLAALAAGIFRGFDFTDEGAYYLSALHPSDVPDRQTTYFLFGRALYVLCGHNLALTRLLLAVLLLAASLVFWRGLRAFVASSHDALRAEWMAMPLGVAIVSAAALAVSIAPLAPSYNLLNAICLLGATGLVCSSVAGSAAPSTLSRWNLLCLLGGATLLLAADFFIKFSTSLTLAGLLGGWYLYASRQSWKGKLTVLGVLLGLSLVLLGGYLLLLQNIPAWLEGIAGTLTALRSHSFVSEVFTRYGGEIHEEIIAALWDFEPAFTWALLGLTPLLLLRTRPALQRWAALLPSAGIVWCLVETVRGKGLFFATGETGARIQLGLLLLFPLLLGLTWLVRRPGGSNPKQSLIGWVLVLGLLILLPLAGSVGTTNHILRNAIYQAAPWSAAVVIMAGLLGHAWQARWLPALTAIFLAGAAATQFWQGYWTAPYRLITARSGQDIPTAIGHPATTLKLDAASHAFVEAVGAQLRAHGFVPGNDIFAFFNLPGMVFTVGGVSPGHPWYFAGDTRSLVLNEMRIRNTAPDRRARAFLIRNGDWESFLPYLHSAGLNFPDAYERCGPVLRNPLTNEEVEVWKPKALP